MAFKSDTNFEGKLTCGSKKDIANLENLHQRPLKSQKCDFVTSFCPRLKMCELKIYREVCVMTMKNDAKIEEELTCQFKIDMRCLTNFDPSTRRTQTITL